MKAFLTAALIVIMVIPPAAQSLPPAAPNLPPEGGSYALKSAARPAGAAAAEAVEHVELLVGRSVVVRTDRPITRVSIPKPDVADAMVTSPTEVLIHGKAPGTISLLVWGDTGHIRSFDVSVRRDLSTLEERVSQLFPGEPITVSSNGADVVLSGTVSSKYVVDKASSLALGYVEKADNVINLLRQAEGRASNQVLLRVRFAEVSRTAMQELGASFFTGAGGYKDWLARTTTQQFPAPDFDNEKGLVFSDFLNLLAFNTKEQLGTAIRALQTKGLFQSLAEPNLVAQNGQEATFLAGGEYPYPVVQGGGLQAAVTIMFKEFGVRLRFTPTIIGNDMIQLKVAPEVSALDFGNAVTVEGFRVPALSTRRTETQVELRDGQTFSIAGLIDNSVTQTMSKVPGLGDIPILGMLFKSRAYQKNATELVVMITPHILRRDSTGVTQDLPQPIEPFLPPPARTFPVPPPAFTTPRPAPVRDEAPAVRAAPAVSPTAPVDHGTVGARPSLAAAAAAANAKATLEQERRQAETERRQAAQAQKQLELSQKEAVERARRQGEVDRKRLEDEKKQAERTQKAEDKLARERAKQHAEAVRRAAEAEKARLDAEKKNKGY